MIKRLKLKLSKLFGLFLFLFLAVFIWTPFHEFIHISILKILNYDWEIYWNFMLLPQVHCINCNTSGRLPMFFYNFSPYIIDLIVLITGFFFSEFKKLRYLMHFGYFDITTNFFMMIFAWIIKAPNDFLNVIRLGFWYVVVLLFVVSTYLWFRINKNLLKNLILKYQSLYMEE